MLPFNLDSKALHLFVVFVTSSVVTTITSVAGYATEPPAVNDRPKIATFSIVAYDPDSGDLGVAVQSKFIAVGAVVPYAEAGVGAIATQALGNTTYGPRGLKMLKAGMAPDAVLEKLQADDPLRERRQVAIVDAQGRTTAFTGKRCHAWAGHLQDENFCVQGNILAGEEVVQAMSKAYEDAEGELADRILAALAAGQEAGGDRRGRQSAALLVVRRGGGYAGLNDRYRDLRVDDHPTPIEELKRIYELHRKIFPPRVRDEQD